MCLLEVEDNKFNEYLNFLKFGKCIFELPRNSIRFQLKHVLKDLYESEIEADVGATFASADELLRLLKKVDFVDLLQATIKELFKLILKSLNREQIEEMAQCLAVIQRNSFFKEIDVQDAIDSFVKELMDQLEKNYQNGCIEEKVDIFCTYRVFAVFCLLR